MKSLLYGLPIALVAMAPMLAKADFSFSVNIAPPALPVYVQPPIPAYGYIWTPGFWSWSDDYDDYYWVPGTWVTAPYVGALWTPGYWAASGDRYGWHDGFWGSHIGFYGGVNYGYGYAGVGYQGGYWDRGEFRYNRTVNNITSTTNITNIYNSAVVNNITNNRVSYNGGFGGIHLRPTVAEQNAGRMQYNMAPTAMQVQHQRAAVSNPMQLASFNQGSPQVAATPAPGAFNSPNVVSANSARSQPAQRSFGGDLRYQRAMPIQQQPQLPQFEQQRVAQPARARERYAPQMTIPVRHEVMQAQPAPNPQQTVRPTPQEYRYQQSIMRAPPVARSAPTPTPMQTHMGAHHSEHATESKFREG